jgi:hypothetical protein
MRLRISMEVLDDDSCVVEAMPPVDAIFRQSINQGTIATAQQLLAEAIERHTRTHKALDGLAHWNGKTR